MWRGLVNANIAVKKEYTPIYTTLFLIAEVQQFYFCLMSFNSMNFGYEQYLIISVLNVGIKVYFSKPNISNNKILSSLVKKKDFYEKNTVDWHVYKAYFDKDLKKNPFFY